MEQFYAALAHTRVAKFFLTAVACLTLSFASNATCDNVTNGGTIGGAQSGCYGFDPSVLNNVSSPSGGSGSLEIIWMYWNASTNWNMTQVSGATGLTYDPGAIYEDTYFRRCSRRAGCSSYDGESNDIFIDITSCVTCNNVTNGGSICCNQTICYGGDPVNIASSTNPSGGSGSLEIIWMYKNASTGWNLTQVSGATGLSYNPGPVYEDTYFRRCARRAGCTDYVGESNDVFIDVNECCNNAITSLVIYNLNNGTTTPLTNGASYTLSSLPASWNVEALISGGESVSFNWTGSYTNYHVENFVPFRSPGDNTALNLGAGTYTLTATVHSQDGASGNACDTETVTFTIVGCDNVTNPGQIGSNQSGCSPFNPAAFTSISLPSGGSGTIEYVWIYRNASTGNVWTTIPNSNSATYDSGPLTQTTEFRRCARRSNCTDYVGESNILTVTVTGPCTPDLDCAMTGYDAINGRIFWIPAYGTDFKSSPGDPLKFLQFSNGTAHMVGTIERISNSNHKFYVSLWFDTKSTFAQWIAMGLSPKSPELGDESSWTYYKFSTQLPNTLTGQGSLTGVNLNVTNQNPIYGLQLGNGANSLNSNANGISAWFSYTGTTSGNGDINGTYECGPLCNLDVNAGPDQEICGPVAIALTSTVTGASNCTTPPVTDCNHSIADAGGWLENSGASAICGDNAGTKLWTQSGNGTSFITLDLGATLPAGSTICARMKLEHCNNSGTGYSNAKIQASANSNSGFVNLVASETFSQTSYQLFCYQLDYAARYIKISDNGNCAFRVDYVEYTTTGSDDSGVTYSWSGPGIVGANNGPSVNVNQPGTYTVTVTDCHGCSDSDTVVVTNDDEDPVFGPQTSEYNLDCGEAIPVIQPIATDNNGAVSYTYTDITTCNNNTPESCDYKTFTQGGWGSPANGNNPGAYRDANFASAFPGGLTIGCASGNTLTLTSAAAVQAFLPSGSTPSALPSDLVNPGNGYNNVLAGQLVALTLSLGFDSYDPNFSGSTGSLGNQLIASGPFAGLTINQVVAAANSVIGGCSNQYSYSALNEVLSNLNENFNGGSNGGFVDCVANDYSCACTAIRRWTATDLCGNTATFDQYFITGDDEGPVASMDPADITIECNDEIPAAPVITFTDECGEVEYTWFEEESTQNGTCNYDIVRIWYATDGCNLTMVNQLVHVEDSTDPVLVGVPANTTAECSNIPTAAVVTATDNCDNNVEVTYTSNTIAGSGCAYIIERTWTATDDCGNEVSATQIIEVTDTTDPTLVGVPASATVECDEIPAVPQVYGEDNCDDNVEVTFDEDITEGCPYTITRTWTGTDNCYNTVTMVQVLTVIDTTYPVLHDVPADMTLECDQTAPEAIVWATDNCDQNMEVSLDASTEVLTCGSIFTRTWSVTDDCGNTTTATQVITFVDTTDPVILNAPVDITVECSDDVPAYVPMWSDNCDDTLTLSAASSIAQDDCYEIIHQTYTATDDCGNSTTVVRNINIIDTTDPILSGVPADATVECSNIPAPAQPTATDNCDENVEIGYNEMFVPGDECSYYLVRSWTAIDECGNTASGSQTLTVTDTTNPILSGEDSEMTLECNIQPSIVAPTATDNCDTDVTIVPSMIVIPGVCENNYTEVYTWTAYDNCGNSAVRSLTIHFQDTTSPELVGVPANATVECDEIPAPADVTAIDNCDTYVPVEFSETATEGCPYTITRTWYGVDNCGNPVSATQILEVIDITYPVLHDVPADMTLECDQTAPEAIVWATDNCDQNMEVSLDASTEVLTCGSIFTRTWSVTDDCGNTTTATQVITFVDTTDPVILNAPVDITVECSDDVPAYVPMWSDNCDDTLTLSAASSIAQDDCYEIIHQTYTATDDCGNSTTVVRNINIVDTTDPILSGVPADATVECSNIPAAAQPTATDNCDENVDIDYTEVMIPGDECTYYLVRTWTATDECDNSVSASQTLTVTDTTNPILSGQDSELTLECNIQPSIVAPTATDNCDTDVTIVPSMIVIPGVCENNYTEVYTWTAYDNCGNSAVRTLTIHFQDTTDPILSGEDSEMTLECNIQPSIIAPTATDNCDTDVTIVPSFQTIPGVCENAWTEVYTWTAYDNCGNTDVRTLTFHFQDTTSPELVGVPANATVECDEIPAPADVTAIDNCDTYVPVEFSETATEGCPYTITRTWYGVDNCGNPVSATQILEVIDITYPVLHDVPADMTLECDQTAPEAIVWATDNCDQNMVVSLDASTEDLVCGSIFTRTWSVTDDCGNTTTATQVITFVDTTDPVILNAPVDITVECSDDVPAYVPMWSDNCDDTLTLSAASSIAQDDCYEIIHQTYTATDDCGNSTTVVRNINIVDTTDPILSGVPADATVECSNIPAPAQPTATDNCDENVDIDYTEVMIPGDECTYYLVRSWTATDECDNSVSASQTLTVTDTTDPILSGQDSEFTLECNIQPSIVAPTATDNCDTDVTIVPSFQTIPGVCENAWTEVYTWTAYDNCGNSAVRTLTIHFQDTTSPELVGVPANATVECDEIPAPADVTAIDNCDTYVPVEFSETATEGCPYTITRTWYGVDNCGNPVSATQILEVIDITYPVLHDVPADMTLECDQTAPEAIVWATDNCDQNMEVSLDASTEVLTCGSIFTRTWSVTDDCGNTTTATQVITFVDTTDPVILNAPVDITVECSDDIPAYVPMWSDNCDDTLTLSAASSIAQDDCYEIIHQTYTATDDCGNSTTVVRNINIVDTTDPILSGVPADATVECSNIPAPAQPTATDNCDENVDIDYTQVMIPGDECTYYLVRTWTATDECDNSVSASQTLTVTDTTDPYITNNPPIEYNIECGEVIPVNDPIFADNCDTNLDVDYSEIEVSGSCPGGLMRTWIATDNCGNTISFVQYIFIHDTTAPVLSGEDEEFTLECNIQPSIVAPTATDACDTDVQVDFNLEVIPGDCPNSWTEVYTWTAEDNCENVSVRTITIHYQDTTAPVLSAYPASGVVECDQVPAALLITASDNCDDEVSVDYNQNIEPADCGYVITRTWTASDDCGNDVSHVQVLTVVDTTDPYVTEGVPAELTIECNTPVPSYTPSFDDNCDEELSVVPTEVEVNFTNCGYDIERSWTATDDCGNAITVYQTIHVVDSIDPILVGVPANTTVECNAIPGAPLVTATDNCDDNVTIGLVTTETEGCPYTITRTWTATDDCGNVTTASQVITVVDTTNPYIVEGVPAELTIECDEDVPAYTPVFGDNCDTYLAISAISGLNNVTPCSYDIERSWTATDNCNNSYTVSQVIHVVDTTNPVLVGVPANVTVECDNVPAPANVTVTDNCAQDLVAYLTADTTMMDCGYVITRTWTAYDYCQNPATATQVVTVVDTTNPVIETVLNDVTIECGEEIPAVPSVVASDNCDANVNISFDSQEVALECGYMIVRSWVATDDCGNEDSAEQIIYVIDETAPIISGIPADVTIECNQPIPAPAAATATDNCDGNVVVTTNDQFIPQDCFYQIKRYYTAVDACGNETSIPQIITVVDTTDPIIEAPADITVNCDEVPAPAELSATDNCDLDVNVTYTENIGEGCPYTIERIWTATDDCGNTTTVSQIVTVIDEVYPVFEAFPPYVVVECDEVQSYMISATDNCDNQVEITVIQEFPVSGECYGSLLRVYQAEDNCGNITISGTQIVDIVDSTPPTLIGVPADVNITCGEELPAVAEVTAEDNCSVDLQVQYTQTQTNEFCPYDVIRTWSTIDDCGNVTVMTQTIHVSVEVPAFVQLSAYPNPADQHFTVKFSVASDKEVKGGIYDVTGREVLPIMNGTADGGRLYQWEMDARSLRQGSYMIQMIVDGEVYHQKMIISVK